MLIYFVTIFEIQTVNGKIRIDKGIENYKWNWEQADIINILINFISTSSYHPLLSPLQ